MLHLEDLQRLPLITVNVSSQGQCVICVFFFFWFNHFLMEDPCARSPCINSHVGQKQSFCSPRPATDAPRRRPSPKQHFSLGRGGNVWDNNRIVIFGSRRSPAHPGLISPPRVSGLFPPAGLLSFPSDAKSFRHAAPSAASYPEIRARCGRSHQTTYSPVSRANQVQFFFLEP